MAKAHTQSRFPDITPGVPIPEFVPGPEPEHVKTMRAILRLWRWSFGAILLLYLVVLTLRPGLTGRIVAMVVALLVWMLPLLIIRPRKAFKKHLSDPWSVPLGLQIQYQGGTWMMIVSVQMINFASDGVFALLLPASIFIAIGGVGLIVAGRFVRQPGPISCIDCSYPLVGLMIPCQCPECGRYILGPGHTTDRPRVKSPWFLWGGLAMMVFGLTMTTLRFTNPGLLYAPVPRAVLLRMAPTDRDAFGRLDTTKLTGEEEQKLIDAMLRQGTNEDYRSSYAQHQWLAQQILAGNLTVAQLDQLFAKTTEIRILAPDRARVDQPVGLRLIADYARSPDFTTTPAYYFQGFAIDDGPPTGGSDQPLFRLYITSDEFLAKSDVPKASWTPDLPGTHVITARIVLALFPAGGTAARIPIDWDQPPGAMFPATPIWSTTIELAHTIEVVPN